MLGGGSRLAAARGRRGRRGPGSGSSRRGAGGRPADGAAAPAARRCRGRRGGRCRRRDQAAAVAVASRCLARGPGDGGGASGPTAAAPPASPRRPPASSSSSRPASDASYSATEAKTGSPADAASARVAGSPDTIDSRLSWVSASRDSSRKLIRDVATREPYGRTTASRAASGGPDPGGGRGDLVVDLEVDDPAGHRQTFIARRTRRRAASSASSDVCSSIAW